MPKATSGTKDRAVSKGRTPASAAPGARRASTFETYEDALKFLDDSINVEKLRPSSVDPGIFKLDRTRAILDRLGHPERDVSFVHVAGSKGKGSTVEMTAACLRGCGYTVGVYTSPHLVDVRERIRINNRIIGTDEFRDAAAAVAKAASGVRRTYGDPTFFELITCIALVYFAEQAVDIAVLETGLGGRLDCTNVVIPEVCAITEIQLEHTQLLGDTLEKIAREKAGIFKPGVSALSVRQQPGAVNVLREVARQVDAPFAVLGEEINFNSRFESSPDLGAHYRVCLYGPRCEFEHLPVPLRGEHQAQNCGLALAILDRLRERGFDTPERKVAEGLASTLNHGRMEVVCARPRVMIDGAHNPESIHALVRSIGPSLPHESMVVIFGCAADKNVDGMLARIALGADKVIFTRVQSSLRAMDPDELSRRFGERFGKMAQSVPSLKDALQIAARAVGRDDLILVTGSFHLAGEAKKYISARTAEREAAARPVTVPPAPAQAGAQPVAARA